MKKLANAFQKFDEYNKTDNHFFEWEGRQYPQEYFLAIQLYEWVLKLAPDASKALLLASRCQHIGRWEIPRESYPDGRVGYLTWRKDLGLFHALKAKEILLDIGFDSDEIAKVERIVLKQRIKTDPEVQTMENALCLVFLQFQYEEFHAKHDAEKVINILKKSLLKMDAHGHQFALSLTYSEKGLAYIQEALKLLA